MTANFLYKYCKRLPLIRNFLSLRHAYLFEEFAKLPFFSGGRILTGFGVIKHSFNVYVFLVNGGSSLAENKTDYGYVGGKIRELDV